MPLSLLILQTSSSPSKRDLKYWGFHERTRQSALFLHVSETTRGSVQILRFRAVSGMPADLKPAKQRSDGGDRIHMHVDRDALIDTVMLMTLGDTARFSRM